MTAQQAIETARFKQRVNYRETPKQAPNFFRAMRLALLVATACSLTTYSYGQSAPSFLPPNEIGASQPLVDGLDDSVEAIEPLGCIDASVSNERFVRGDVYFDFEYLLWDFEGADLTTLLVANPVGTPLTAVGLPSEPSTQTVIGGQSLGDLSQSGLRLRAGRIVDGDLFSRWEISSFVLFESTESLIVGTDTNGQLLTRPFFNTQTGQPDAQAISLPGIVDGSLGVEYSRRFWGLDPTVFLCLSGDCCSSREAFSGYRFLRYEDQITIDESVLPVSNAFIAPGSEIRVLDTIRARNNYHLIPLGINYSRRGDRWRVNIRGSIGLGVVTQRAELSGSTTNLVNGAVTSTADGGFAVLSSNAGEFSQTRFAWVPELNLNLRRHIRGGLWLQFGYSLLYLNDVARAPTLISTSVYPNLLPPTTATGTDPAFSFVSDSELIHGLNVFLQWNY